MAMRVFCSVLNPASRSPSRKHHDFPDFWISSFKSSAELSICAIVPGFRETGEKAIPGTCSYHNIARPGLIFPEEDLVTALYAGPV